MRKRKYVALMLMASSFFWVQQKAAAEGDCTINGCSCGYYSAYISLATDCNPPGNDFDDVCDTACRQCTDGEAGMTGNPECLGEGPWGISCTCAS